LPYSGRSAPLEAAARDGSDLAWCADPHTYPAFRSHRARRHVYYCVLEKDPGLGRALADPAVVLAANASPLRRRIARHAGRPVLDGAGGINTTQFHPNPGRRSTAPLRVLVNGRRSRPKKGTDLILRALARLEGRLPTFEIVLFDTPGPGDPDPRDTARCRPTLAT